MNINKEESSLKYMVLLEGKTLNFFWNLDKLFSFQEAKDWIEFVERMYPANKGYYKIFKIEQVK